ncbi:MAG: dihydrofolate synthase/folylpolyglutamate synthase [Lentimonas sp.]|jgi:dihydrofolate synthase/folylpolyglutamate synthase
MVFLPHYPKNQISNHVKSSEERLEMLRVILQKLNNPQQNLPPVIHVAGTNGKGSICTFLAAILQQSNYKTHIYTSPHLHHCNERISVAGNLISDGNLHRNLEEVRAAAEGENLTLFEALTLAAILAFSQNKADICIIETGMGGKFDATNLIDQKIATILSEISFDHQEFLGDQLGAIALHKAGIMRPRTPCFLAPQNVAANLMIKITSLEIENELFSFDEDFTIEANSDGGFNFSFGEKEFNNLPKPTLAGNHQYLNASLAIATLSFLEDFKIPQLAIEKGLKNAFLPSRLQKMSCKILNPEDEIYLDGAHNQSGFEALSEWICEKISQDEKSQKSKRNYLITGFSKGKAKAELFEPFKEIIDFICPVKVLGESNSENPKEVLCEVLKSEIEEALIAGNLEETIRFLVNLDQQNPCRIVICGSFYLARDFKLI